MRTVCYLLSLSLIIFSGCQDPSISKQLEEIDSLIVAEQKDSAYHLIMSIVGDEIIEPEDRAHYNLLLTQTSYLVGHPLESDSLLDQSIVFYQKDNNSLKLADAYYYKGIGKFMERDYNQSIAYYKKAEEQSKISETRRQQFKTAEGIAFVNSMSGQYEIALRYARQALDLATTIANKKWLADAYYRVGMAYSNMEQPDSAISYYNMTEPYIDDVQETDRPYFLSNLGLAYMDKDLEKSKYYLMQALSYRKTTRIFEYLSDIAFREKDYEESHQLLMKAMAVNDLTPKDNIIHNLLEYDIEHGKTDNVCEQVNRIIAIKDSIINKVKNDTIKDLQLRFDHQVEMNAANKRLIHWQWALGGLAFLILFLVGYIFRKKHVERLKQLEIEMKVRNFKSQILKLEVEKANAETQILALKSADSQNQQELKKLEEVRESTMQDLQMMEEKLKKWLGKETSKIRNGILLYDKIEKNGKINMWMPEDYESFIDYYEIGHPEKMRKIRCEYSDITQRNTVYLILEDMKKSPEEIRLIMSLEKGSIRSLKFRLRKYKEK